MMLRERIADWYVQEMVTSSFRAPVKRKPHNSPMFEEEKNPNFVFSVVRRVHCLAAMRWTILT